MTTRRQVIELFATLSAGALLGAKAAFGGDPSAAAGHRVSRTRLALGCAVRCTVVGAAGEDGLAEAAAQAALDAVGRVDAELSLFLPGSALSRLNREGFLAEVPESLRQSLAKGLEMAHASGGAFDPSVQPLIELVARSFKERGGPPSDALLGEARSRVDWRRVQLVDSTVTLPKGFALTLNGVAKGYAMDLARRALLARGASEVLITASGDMAVEGSGFRLALQDPLHPEQLLDRPDWKPPRGGVGSSGGYMNAFTIDRKWHHIVDPRTGRSPTHFSGVVVHAASALEADALSTACFVLAEPAALALADSRGAALLAVRADGSTVRSRGADAVGL
jgi:thiamine biosynthesis lipoprotein